ncbi:NUDIX domain-containing protein [soil metagenome]
MLLKIWKKLNLPQPLQVFLMRFANDQFLIGVTGVIFNEKNEVLILKHTYRKVAWSLPGGYLKANEHPKVGLAREIMEETRFTVHVIKIIRTQTDHKGRLDMCYYGIFEGGTFKPSEEVIDYKFVDPLHLPKLLDDQYKQIAEACKRKKQYDAEHRWQAAKKKIFSLFQRNH